MHEVDVKAGQRVKVVKIVSTEGFMIHPKHLKVRAVGVTGTTINSIEGHGGEVWWIKQDNGAIGAYIYYEFELENNPNFIWREHSGYLKVD